MVSFSFFKTGSYISQVDLKLAIGLTMTLESAMCVCVVGGGVSGDRWVCGCVCTQNPGEDIGFPDLSFPAYSFGTGCLS